MSSNIGIGGETMKIQKYTDELQEKRKKKERELVEKTDVIGDAFRGAEKPDPLVEAPEEAGKYREGCEKMTVEGARYDHPTQRWTIYGTGKWWILQPDEGKIWQIINSEAGGDDWERNNVWTSGSGAIGQRIDWDDEIADLIREVGLKKGR